MSAFVPLAVPSRWGPHVTPTAGVEIFGRYWTTTSRSAYKTLAVTRHGVAGYMVADRDQVAVLRGRAVVVDPLRPWLSVPDMGAAAVAPLAAVRVGVEHVAQVLGYMESWAGVLPGWSVADRVLIAVTPERELLLDRSPSVTMRPWAKVDRPRFVDRLGVPAGAARPAVPTIPEHVIASIESVATGTHDCIVGLEGLDSSRDAAGVVGPLAVPARWADGTLSLPESIARNNVVGRWSAMFHASEDRRPGAKFGWLVRGEITPPRDRDDRRRTVRIRMLTWWDGFRSASVPIVDRPPRGPAA